jgi:predicted DsbA family dithiol-disulfide isomerase
MRGDGEAGRAQPHAVRMEVWADVQCIWCYISSARVRTAIAEYGAPVDVVYRSFLLTPDAPVDIDADAARRAHDVVPGRMAQIMAQLRRLTAHEALAYDPDRTRPTNSRLALELLHHADTRNRRPELMQRLFEAYFAEGRHLGRAEELLTLAEEIGLDRDAAATALADGRHAPEVDADIRRARALGAQGVPFIVVDGRFGLSGAQPVEQLRGVLERAAAG